MECMASQPREEAVERGRLRNRRKQQRYRDRWQISPEAWAEFLQAFTSAAEEGQKNPLTKRLPDYPADCIAELTRRLEGGRLIFCKSRKPKDLKK